MPNILRFCRRSKFCDNSVAENNPTYACNIIIFIDRTSTYTNNIYASSWGSFRVSPWVSLVIRDMAKIVSAAEVNFSGGIFRRRSTKHLQTAFCKQQNKISDVIAHEYSLLWNRPIRTRLKPVCLKPGTECLHASGCEHAGKAWRRRASSPTARPISLSIDKWNWQSFHASLPPRHFRLKPPSSCIGCFVVTIPRQSSGSAGVVWKSIRRGQLSEKL